jgi:hypothetical protein
LQKAKKIYRLINEKRPQIRDPLARVSQIIRPPQAPERPPFIERRNAVKIHVSQIMPNESDIVFHVDFGDELLKPRCTVFVILLKSEISSLGFDEIQNKAVRTAAGLLRECLSSCQLAH